MTQPSLTVSALPDGLSTRAAIEQRRAVKHYDRNFVMPDADRAELFRLALLSPTSFNIQNWRLIDVRDPSLRRSVRDAAWDQAQVTDAAMLLVICGSITAWADRPERYWADAPETVQNTIVPMIGQFYQGRDQVQRDEVMRSGGIIAQTIMLAAKSMGYDSCPMIGFDPDKVAELIGLPQGHAIALMLAIGKATKPANPRGGQLPLGDIIRVDRF